MARYNLKNIGGNKLSFTGALHFSKGNWQHLRELYLTGSYVTKKEIK